MSNSDSPNPKPEPKKPTTADHIVGSVVLLLMIFGLVRLFFACQKSASENEDKSGLALVLCERAAQSALKAPSTAKFPGMMERTLPTKTGENSYQWSSWVDSQNSYGAMIRTNFTCEFDGTTARVKFSE